MIAKRIAYTLAAAAIAGGSSLAGFSSAHRAAASNTLADYSAPQATISDFEFPDGFGPSNNVVSDATIQSAMSDGLDVLDNKLNEQPDLATSLPSISNGGAKIVGGNLQVTWTLKPNLKWADGTPLTAKDFVFGVKLIETPGGGGSAGEDPVLKMSAPNDTTIVVTYKGLYSGYLLQPPSLYNYVDMAKKYKAGDLSSMANDSYDATQWAVFVGGAGATSGSAVATESSAYKASPMKTVVTGWAADSFTTPDDGYWNGPYKLGEYVQNQRITLVPNTYYNVLGPGKDASGKTVARPSKIVFANISSNEAAYVTALQSPSTQVDMAQDFQVSDIPILTGISRFKTVVVPGLELEHLELNTTHKPLNNPLVRQALALAVDKPALVHQLFPQIPDPSSVVADSLYPHLMPWTDPSIKSVYDLAQAKKLLQQAGYSTDPQSSGKHVYLTMDTTSRQPRVKALQILQRDWLKIGVIAKINYPRPSTGQGGLFADWDHNGLLARGNFDVALFAWNFTVPNPDEGTFFDPKFIPSTASHSANQQNDARVNDPIVTQAELSAKTTLDTATQHKYYNIAQQQVIKQAYWIPLFVRSDILVHNGSITNFKANPNGLHTWNTFEWGKAAQ